MTTTLPDAAALEAFARTFAARLRPGDVVALHGDLGAGKTAFVRAAATALGVTSDVSSPTFVFRQRYAGATPVEHLDLYRLDDESELAELGLADAFGGDAIAFVEWAERAPSLIPAGATHVTIEGAGETPRRVTVHA